MIYFIRESLIWGLHAVNTVTTISVWKGCLFLPQHTVQATITCHPFSLCVTHTHNKRKNTFYQIHFMFRPSRVTADLQNKFSKNILFFKMNLLINFKSVVHPRVWFNIKDMSPCFKVLLIRKTKSLISISVKYVGVPGSNCCVKGVSIPVNIQVQIR